MHVITSLFVLYGGLLATALAYSQPAPQCHDDACLRAAKNPVLKAIVTPFCSSYIGIPKVTVTAKTVTSVTTITQVNTVTVDAFGAPVKRSWGVRNHKLHVPQCLSNYHASQISSACSCLSIPKATVSVTATAPVSTVRVSTTTTVTSLPGPCQTPSVAPANQMANAWPFADDGNEDYYPGPGAQYASVEQCCAACYNLPGCFSYLFYNFVPETIDDPSYTPADGVRCDIRIGYTETATGLTPNSATCPEPEGVTFFERPVSETGAGPGDFFIAGLGPCAKGFTLER